MIRGAMAYLLGAFDQPVRRIMRVCAILSFTLTFLVQPGCDKRSAGSAPPSNSFPDVPAASLVPLTNMVLVKAGTFMRQNCSVTISRDFWLGKYEVTQGEYEGVMGTNPSRFAGETNRPVEKVRHYEALAYCSALSKRETLAGRLPRDYAYRLPTEAEWEYACRAGTTNLYSFGDDIAQADKYAWTLENGDGTTHPVGLKQPNPWGFCDMHGNVWEWTQDWFADYPSVPSLVDPTGPAVGKFKVFRGGSWNHAIEMARSRNRFMMPSTNGIYFVGFRVALSQRRK
jgi:formylglycine-generating enzyme required for sulfatase activity